VQGDLTLASDVKDHPDLQRLDSAASLLAVAIARSCD
jgi:hypothetical protein